MSIATFLPTPIHTPLLVHHPAEDAPLYPDIKTLLKTSTKIPPYGSRQMWVPRTSEDFGDGGAFPEIHVAQYPLDMGRKLEDSSNNTLLLL